MFSDEHLTSTKSKADDDGAKRLFFGGERFLDDISGKAFITMHRTEQNNPLGLEVQVHIPEANCSSLSEPGLRALLRFMTGMYVCMNRGDIGPRSTQSTAEAAGCSIVQVAVEHIFVRIKDADFQLELLLQKLNYMRSSVTNGEIAKTLARISIGGLFLRDTYSDSECTLLQPAKHPESDEAPPVPNFANAKFWPRIYPLGESMDKSGPAPMLIMYSVQTVPSPSPPTLASQAVVQCRPLKLVMQESSCLRLASFLVDGVVVEHGVVSPATSVDSTYFSLKQLDVVIPVNSVGRNEDIIDTIDCQDFTGARLQIEDFIFVQSPLLTLKSLELDKDPACFMLWQGQPIDASQRRWVARAMHLSIALDMGTLDSLSSCDKLECSDGLWRCVEMSEPFIEVAMVTGDGEPILTVPPPGGIVRLGVHCKQLTSNTSVEQLFFVLRIYEHIGKVNDSLLKVTRTSKKQSEVSRASSLSSTGSFGNIREVAPGDTGVCLGLGILELKFLESLSGKSHTQGPPLVQIRGSGIELKVSHRTLGGAMAITSKVVWQDALVECVETSTMSTSSFDVIESTSNGSRCILRPVFWIRDGMYEAGCDPGLSIPVSKSNVCFLNINVSNVIPFRVEDAECHSLRAVAEISGIRLGGGIVYSETLLHHFGVLAPDGGPGKELKKVLRNLSNGPLSRLLRSTPQTTKPVDNNEADWELGVPDAMEISVHLKDWVFALEADPEGIENAHSRREKCWHTAFQCLSITAKGGQKDLDGSKINMLAKHPLKGILVSIEGFEFIKPVIDDSSSFKSSIVNGLMKKQATQQASSDGLNIEVLFCLKEDNENFDMHLGQWAIKKVKSGIRKPVEFEATKEDIDYLIETARLEIEAASRVAAGLMQLLELEGSIGQGTIQQLSSIGSGSLDRLRTVDKEGRRSSVGSIGSLPLWRSNHKDSSIMDINLTRLEELIMSSREACTNMSSGLESGHLNSNEAHSQLKQLIEHLDAMYNLVLDSKSQS
ncbi:hypothetical protein KP509_32G041400 [Ceratopteris richardii]|nr:hypothetical protein KP509_32G041400 [Ceratopteris richardii]